MFQGLGLGYCYSSSYWLQPMYVLYVICLFLILASHFVSGVGFGIWLFQFLLVAFILRLLIMFINISIIDF